ncbi:hypothetical protein FOPG_08882 [Fusarium oxysporum f. sp. conglutinans race 2 54008]|uniref:Uncharacterized protein n=2 Tax=Fusarium oxysporum TaxID=5507 RepID=W9NYR9_FUSOX|nr:hypothetical protein FOVG_12052 [Fusarium oxysporum f. sp. pisi HDV247]EXA38038.1 hypothetical protein FOVG_12052 [Fusarium oxysporum f. sp. pisi HDV247]EXA38039.1 hypothetical protein FOVG_12052 [Fusarium oxysporum f. sp. pisi HDV247]EXL76440.1 hypothetical protein FOPG_08882 [Fusarium oxysporum f. sp. conglutinans race 2 54008]
MFMWSWNLEMPSRSGPGVGQGASQTVMLCYPVSKPDDMVLLLYVCIFTYLSGRVVHFTVICCPFTVIASDHTKHHNCRIDLIIIQHKNPHQDTKRSPRRTVGLPNHRLTNFSWTDHLSS